MSLDDFQRSGADLISEVLWLCDDPLGERFTRARVLDILNETAADLAIRNMAVTDTVYVQLTAAQDEYNVEAFIAADSSLHPFAHILQVELVKDADYRSHIHGGPVLRPISTMRLDLQGIDLSDEGTPYRFRLDILDPGEIALAPMPSTDGGSLAAADYEGNLKVYYCGLPEPMTDSASSYPDSFLPVRAHGALAYGAAARLLEEGGEGDLAMAGDYQAEYERVRRGCVGDQYRGLTTYHGMEPA